VTRKYRFSAGSSYPEVEDMQRYFDNYDDILDSVADTGCLLAPVNTVIDSSEDSLAAFHRRHPYYITTALDEEQLREYEEREHRKWEAWWQARARERDIRAARDPKLSYPLPPPIPRAPRRPRRLQLLPPVPPPPPKRAIINPFALVRRRKLMVPILEKTRRIREQLQRHHDAGPEEYLR
jgi:hypothetical protein